MGDNFDITNCIIIQNNPNSYSVTAWDTLSISYSYFSSQQSAISMPPNQSGIITGHLDWSSGNISQTPQFADSANGDYTLVPGSIGLDAGNPDLNGNGIPWQNDPEDQDPDGTRMDMGYGYALHKVQLLISVLQ